MKKLVRIFTAALLVLVLTLQIGMQAEASTRIAGLPPSEQTSYKLYCGYTTKVKTVKRRANDLLYSGALLLSFGTIMSKAFPTLGYVVSVNGSIISVYGTKVTNKLSEFKNDSKYIVKQYFRWKTSNSKDYRAYLKTQVYVEYNNKVKVRITDIKQQTELIDFADVE